MATETVVIRGRTRDYYLGAETAYVGSDHLGELYEVTIGGVTMPGRWDGDARHETVAYPCDIPGGVEAVKAALAERRRAKKAGD